MVRRRLEDARHVVELQSDAAAVIDAAPQAAQSSYGLDPYQPKRLTGGSLVLDFKSRTLLILRL